MGGHRRHKQPTGQIQNQKCLTVPQRRLVWNNALANQTPCHSHTYGTSFPYWLHQNSSVLISIYYICQQHHHPKQQRQADSCPPSLSFFRGLQIWTVMDLDSISYWGAQLVELSLACTKSTGFNHLHLIKPHMGGCMVVISELKRRQHQKFKITQPHSQFDANSRRKGDWGGDYAPVHNNGSTLRSDYSGGYVRTPHSSHTHFLKLVI